MSKSLVKVNVTSAWKPENQEDKSQEKVVKDVAEFDFTTQITHVKQIEHELTDYEMDLIEGSEGQELPAEMILMDIINGREEERVYVTKELVGIVDDVHNIFTGDTLHNDFLSITCFGVDEAEELEMELLKLNKANKNKSPSGKAVQKDLDGNSTVMPNHWPFNQSHNQNSGTKGNRNVWKIPQGSQAEVVKVDEELFPKERPPNDWDLIKTPPRPKPKKRGKFIKRKWFAGDKCAAWYKNEFYVAKVVLVTPKDKTVQLHFPNWDYEKDKEVKEIILIPEDEIYRLRTFDLEGREETKHIRWQEGDLCWAWYTNENQYYCAWFQKFDETNCNYCHVVFEGFEEDGLYMCATNFVIPNYMWNEKYLKYNLKNDKDLVLDQDKTTVRKEAALLRRARNARRERGENKEFYLQPLEEERPWGENGVVGMTNQPTTLKKKYEPALPAASSAASPSTSYHHPMPISRDIVPKSFNFVQRKKPVEEEETFEEADDSEQSDVEDDGFGMGDRDLPSYTQTKGDIYSAELGLQAQFGFAAPRGTAPLVVPVAGQSKGMYGSQEPLEATEVLARSLQGMRIAGNSAAPEPSPFSSLTAETCESSPFQPGPEIPRKSLNAAYAAPTNPWHKK